jgi:hypothetical protein
MFDIGLDPNLGFSRTFRAHFATLFVESREEEFLGP